MSVAEKIRDAREHDPHAMGLSLVFVYAEREVLQDLIDALEELLEVCQELFGSTAWLPHALSGTATPVEGVPVHREETLLGWLSTIPDTQ
jgi:hypothetical protein